MKEIPMSRGGRVAIVDDSDFERLAVHKWHCQNSKPGLFYAVRKVKRVNGAWYNVPMHREITKAKDGVLIDHIDGDGLNNRRANLRCATIKENNRNRRVRANNKSGYTGVYREGNHWTASICVDGKQHFLGQFDTPEEGAKAYDYEARKHFGEFARLNFPDGDYSQPENPFRRTLNRRNTSGYRGVIFNKRMSRWAAGIRVNGKAHHLGYFDNPELAARAFDAAAISMRGTRTKLNFPVTHEIA